MQIISAWVKDAVREKEDFDNVSNDVYNIN